jgi:hypothetical protein
MGPHLRSWRAARPGADGAWVVLTAILATSAAAWPNPESAGSPPLLSDAEREAFLLEGEIIKDRPIPEGVTLPRRVTLRRGGYEHDALVQTHDEHEARKELEGVLEIDFRDSWRNNVAAYRLDRLLGLGFVPVTVVRSYRRDPAGWTWWVDDVLMSERERYERKIPPPEPLEFVSQMQVVRVFDQLIFNFDRNLENLLIDKDWQVWMIDHSRAFKIFAELRDEKSLPQRCEKHLLAALRRLERPTLDKTMEDLLTGPQIDGLLGRRDRIVRFYDDLIAARGESVVLYELPPRLTSTADPQGEPLPR